MNKSQQKSQRKTAVKATTAKSSAKKQQQKRSFATKARKTATRQQSPQLQFQLAPLASLTTPQKRRFATKSNDQEPQQDNQEGGNQEQQQEQAQEDQADPLVICQRRVSNQANEIAALQRQLNDHKMIVDEWQSKARQLQERVKHEIEEQHNIHDRYKREIADVKKFSVGKFAKGLLEGVDALEAASKATEAALQRTSDEKFVQLADGLKMTTALFHKALASEGITKFDSLGQTVDPHLHFITAQLPHPTAPAGTITHMLKEGYHIHDRVLRPAQVVVAHSPNSV